MRYRFMRFPGGKMKAVTLSYDDGDLADLKMLEIINRYGMKCTFNLNSDWVLTDARPGHVTREDIQKYMLSAGHEVAVHGKEHRASGLQRPIDGIQDVLNCRLELEKALGCIIRGMAYPDCGITRFQNGGNKEDIQTYLKYLDIAYARTLRGDNNSFLMPTDWHAWMPTIHHNNSKAFDYAEEFLQLPEEGYVATRHPRLFYMWGHSYEFNNDNNWDRLEQLCEILGNKENVWYATNMEIFEYAQAYERLVFSADGKRIYNPNLMDVWFWVDGKTYCVQSGQTLVLAD